jgi:hypothetical protein
MKNRTFNVFIVPALLALWLLNAPLSTAHAQGTAFTYQGQLQNNGSLASGTYNLTFALFTNSTAGTPVAGPVTNSAVVITNGLFTVAIDFGPGPWNGQTNWLQIGVETNGASPFTPLAPRQKLTPTPYAIYAENANTASNLSGTVSTAQLSGTVGNNQLANNSITVNAGTGLSGGGAAPLGGFTTLNNAGVTALTGGGGVTVSAASGSVTLGSTATSANTANAIVSRDGSGNFSAGSLTLNTSLSLPATTANAGIIYSGAGTLMQAWGTQNFFAGFNAGNLTMGGTANLGVGWQALFSDTSGGQNTGIGVAALEFDTSGAQNTAVGNGVMEFNSSGGQNTATGTQALRNNTTGSDNTALGYEAGNNISTGSSNIDIGNQGLATDTNIIRIGSGQSQTFIAGVITGNGAGLTNLNFSSQNNTGTNTTTRLLFPFVSNQAGYDTGIVIANTTSDPFGTAATNGNATIYFFGPTAPTTNPYTTPTIAAGSVYTVQLSLLASGYQGYLIVVCNFPMAHGYGDLLSGTGSSSTSTMTPALVLPSQRSIVLPESLGQ